MAVRSALYESCAAAVGQDRAEPRLRGPGAEAVAAAAAAAAMEPAAPPNELVSAEGRNRKAVLCQRCGSRVLQPGTALFSRRQVERPGRGLGEGPGAAAGTGRCGTSRTAGPKPQVLGTSFSSLQVTDLNTPPSAVTPSEKAEKCVGELAAGQRGVNPATCGPVTQASPQGLRPGASHRPPGFGQARGAHSV